MTGRYHARNGALGTGGAWGQTKEDVTTVAHVFAKGGYQTAMFGKWHMGDTYPLRPEDRGFQEVVSCENGSTLTKLVDKKGYRNKGRVLVSPHFAGTMTKGQDLIVGLSAPLRYGDVPGAFDPENFVGPPRTVRQELIAAVSFLVWVFFLPLPVVTSPVTLVGELSAST